MRLLTLANSAFICQEKMQITSKPRHKANQRRSNVPTNRLMQYKCLEKHVYSLVSYSQSKTSTAINTIGGDKPGMRLIWISLQGTNRNAKKITKATQLTSICSIHLSRKYFRMSLLEQAKSALQNTARRK